VKHSLFRFNGFLTLITTNLPSQSAFISLQLASSSFLVHLQAGTLFTSLFQSVPEAFFSLLFILFSF